MTEPVILGALVGLILALVAEVIARGRSIEGWAIVAVCIGLLWAKLAGLL